MKVRGAKISDVKAIHALVNSYAEQDQMLFRSMADIYKGLQTFLVAEENGTVAGCCSLEIIWSDLAEVKSLAVADANKGCGVGKMLVREAIERARGLGAGRVFALTLNPEFFRKMSFELIDKALLPMKVWSDCARCPKQAKCDEVAVVRKLEQGGIS